MRSLAVHLLSATQLVVLSEVNRKNLYRILDLGLHPVKEIVKNADHSGIIAVVFSKFLQNFRRNILLHRRYI